MIEYGVFAVGKPDAALVGETNMTSSESAIRAAITGADTNSRRGRWWPECSESSVPPRARTVARTIIVVRSMGRLFIPAALYVRLNSRLPHRGPIYEAPTIYARVFLQFLLRSCHRLPSRDLPYNPLSTTRRQPGILVHVHPVLPWNLKLQQPQLPRSELARPCAKTRQ